MTAIMELIREYCAHPLVLCATSALLTLIVTIAYLILDRRMQRTEDKLHDAKREMIALEVDRLELSVQLDNAKEHLQICTEMGQRLTERNLALAERLRTLRRAAARLRGRALKGGHARAKVSETQKQTTEA